MYRLKKKIVFFFVQNIDYGYTLEPPRRGGSNVYPQSIFWSNNKKNRYSPANPQFFLYKSGVEGGKHFTDMFSCTLSGLVENWSIWLKSC